ncbi:MAG: carbohydrate ABC transporter permease [Clostridia bacterium]|nr:carbohydrate ABC transporter permease [Clostridia bacterium]
MIKQVRERKIETKSVVSAVVLGTIGVIMAVFALSLVVPIVWMLINSLKDDYDYLMNPFGLPSEGYWMWSNYPYAFEALKIKDVWQPHTHKLVTFDYWGMFYNSAVFALGTAFMGVFAQFITAYAVSKYDFPCKKLIYNTAILTMIIPVVGTLGASLQVRKVLGIYDNMLLHILTASGGFGFNFVLLYNALKALSWSYAEAAFMDGAGHYTVMFKIFLPMMFPILFSLFVLSFIGSWNDYSTILTYLPSTPNLAYGVYYFEQSATSKRHTDPQVLAAFVWLAVPTSLLWVIAQKWLLNSLTMGGLKG